MRRVGILARSVVAVCIAAAGTSGCKMVDQRTFERTGRAPTQTDVARADRPALPLVTIFMDQQDVDWQTPLAAAAHAAEDRKPGVEFNVVTAIPTSAAQNLQDLFAKFGAVDTQIVATALLADQVPSDRVHIGYRGDPGAPRLREVRVYVR